MSADVASKLLLIFKHTIYCVTKYLSLSLSLSDCSRSAVFLLSGSVLLSWQHYGMLSALHSFRRPKAISSAGTVRCFRCYINLFSSAQSYPVFFGSGPVRKSVSGVDGDVGGLYVIVYGGC